MNGGVTDRICTKERDIDYLTLLAKQYPSISAATTEIINLQAILDLPNI